jgi:hypothetical protein
MSIISLGLSLAAIVTFILVIADALVHYFEWRP